MFSGGTDTSTVPIEWALVELLANPEKMALLQNELAEVVGNAKLVDISDIPNLPYLTAVVKETMRMHLVVPLVLSHKLMQSCELFGYEILADTQVFVNVWAISHDPCVWDNPSEFLPRRFLEMSQASVHGPKNYVLSFLLFIDTNFLSHGLLFASFLINMYYVIFIARFQCQLEVS